MARSRLLVVVAARLVWCEEAAVTVTYRLATEPPKPWRAATFIGEGAAYVRIARRGGFATPAPTNASTNDWLTPGAWVAHLARTYGVGGLASPRPGDVDVIVKDGAGLGDVARRGHACPRRDDEPYVRFNWHAPYAWVAPGAAALAARGGAGAVPGAPVRYFRRRTAVDPPPAAYANGSWVEVSHCGGSKFETEGAFFYAFRGSGVFANVGRTLAFENHQDAALHLLGRPCSRRGVAPGSNNAVLGIFQCDRELAAVAAAARAAGWDSLQFTHHCDAFCEVDGAKVAPAVRGTARRSQVCGFEVLVTGTSGATACPPGVEFRQGPNASRPCACDPASRLRSQRGSCATCREPP